MGVDNRKTTAYHPESNGLVEAHNKIIKTKLHKMVKETGEEWPSKLQAVVLAANTCWKRSTDYSPFYLMYGREANCIELFSHTNIRVEIEDIDDLNNMQILTNPDEGADTFSHDSENPDEWICPLMEARSISRTNAHANILKEQLKQKHVFDSKVKKNR